MIKEWPTFKYMLKTSQISGASVELKATRIVQMAFSLKGCIKKGAQSLEWEATKQ